MPTAPRSPSGWLRHFVYRKTSLRTTWTFRLLVLAVVALVVVSTRALWVPSMAKSLVCDEDVAPSDAILVENFDPSYVVFERAAVLQRAGLARRVLVPVVASGNESVANPVSRGIAELMARLARLEDIEVIPVRHVEPVSLNVAYRVRDVLASHRLRSVIVVAPGFRSRRSVLVYRAVLAPAEIQSRCAPVVGEHAAEDWTRTWHGIVNVVEQRIKLEYYRLYVLPKARVRASVYRWVVGGAGLEPATPAL